MKTSIEIDAGTRTFASGLLPELIAALRRCRPGELLTVFGCEASIGVDLAAWCRFTRNTLIDTTTRAGCRRGSASPETSSRGSRQACCLVAKSARGTFVSKKFRMSFF